MIGAAISQARSEVKNEMNKGDFPIEELWDMVGSDLKKFASGTEHNPKIMAWTVMYLQGRGDVPQWVVDQYNLAYLFSDTFHETLDKIIKRYGDVDSAIRVLQALSQAQRTRSYSDTILVFSEILSAGSGYAPPGFREMLEYYAEATDAIAGKIEDIELQLGENTLNEIQILKCNEIRYGSSLMSGGKFSYRWAESILEEYMESVGRKGEKNSKVKEFEKACR